MCALQPPFKADDMEGLFNKVTLGYIIIYKKCLSQIAKIIFRWYELDNIINVENQSVK